MVLFRLQGGKQKSEKRDGNVKNKQSQSTRNHTGKRHCFVLVIFIRRHKKNFVFITLFFWFEVTAIFFSEIVNLV